MYGLEEIVEGRVLVDPGLEAAQPAVAAARRDLAADPAVTACGAHIEDKRYSVAVHTRRVADPGRWAGPVAEAAADVATHHGLEVVPGKMVWELRPHVRSDKGDAVRRVVAESGARSVLVAGDDLGDLPAFAVAAELGRGLRVAVRSAEAPPELLDAADLVVDGPEGPASSWSTCWADRGRWGAGHGARQPVASVAAVRIESSVTAVSWVPLDCVEGGQRLAFHVGAAQYDDPPPQQLEDLPSLLAEGRVRFANQLRGYAEVRDGRIVASGQSGRGYVGASREAADANQVGFAAVPLPDLRPDPETGRAGCGSARRPAGCCRSACPTGPARPPHPGWPPRPPGPPCR